MERYFDSWAEREEFIQKANIIVLDYGIKKIEGVLKHWVEYKFNETPRSRAVGNYTLRD